MSEEATYAWEQLPEESGKAFAAFCAYRNLGVRRSILAAYRQEKRNESATAADGTWTRWSSLYRWRERAEAYDAHLERIARSEKEAEHFAELEAYRHRQKRLAQSAIEAAIALLKKSSARLEQLDAADIPVKSLPMFFRAAQLVAQAATDSEAQAIAVTDLLALLDADRA